MTLRLYSGTVAEFASDVDDGRLISLMERDVSEAREMRAGSFGGIARDYESGRALYPDEAVGWLVEGASRVVDLGAGTGKLTGAISRYAAEVVALEPQRQMLLHLRRAAPSALAACSVAESLPVRSEWADVVVVARAFHWFDQQRAVPEIRRILSPEGRLGLIWNVRDESLDWVAALARIAGPENSLETRSRLDQLRFRALRAPNLAHDPEDGQD